MKATEQTEQKEIVSPAVVAAIVASVCLRTGRSAETLKFTSIKQVSGIQPAWAFIGTAHIIAARQRYLERGK